LRNLSEVLPILLIFCFTACSSIETPAAVSDLSITEGDSQVAESTAQPSATFTPGATFTATPSLEPTATNTLVPTPTVSPSLTPTPIPIAKVDDTLTLKVNIRSGPSTEYPVVTQFDPGQEAVVTGRSEDNSWWQINLSKVEGIEKAAGWIASEFTIVNTDANVIPIAQAPPLPTATFTPEAVAEADASTEPEEEATIAENGNDENLTPEELAAKLECGKDFCVTYQALIPIWENGGCVGNHSIYITVLEGLPPGKPMDGVVIGDTYNNVEVGSGSHGPGRTEITLWSNSMTLVAKRRMDGSETFTSEESFNFTAHDELIPADVLASAGYCGGSVEQCREAQQHNQVCRGHYSWRVTFHKFD
jgi:uncharacterized protein YraI